jgi:hypothetical protein
MAGTSIVRGFDGLAASCRRRSWRDAACTGKPKLDLARLMDIGMCSSRQTVAVDVSAAVAIDAGGRAAPPLAEPVPRRATDRLVCGWVRPGGSDWAGCRSDDG